MTLSGNYLPLSGGDVSGSTYFSKDTAGMVDGSASLYVPNGHFFVGSSATTNYCTISSERQCTRDNNRINATQYFTNADGRSKFSHKGNGVKNGKDDAYMCFNQDGFKVAYSHSFGVLATTEYQIIDSNNINQYVSALSYYQTTAAAATQNTQIALKANSSDVLG